MELIKLKLLDTDGMTLLTAPAAGQVSLVYMNAYKPGGPCLAGDRHARPVCGHPV